MAGSKREPWLPLRWWGCLGLGVEVESSYATVWLAGNLGRAWRWPGGACEHTLQRFDLTRAKATGPPTVPLDGSEHFIPPDKLRAAFVRPPRGIWVPIVPWSTASTIAKEWLVAQELQCLLLIALVGRPDLEGVWDVAHCLASKSA